MTSPISIARAIGDKLIRDTRFEYKLEVAPVNHSFHNENIDGLQFVDFGRTFGLGRPAVAYALTQLVSPGEMEMEVQVEHNDGCRIWLNGLPVYESRGDRDIHLVREERSLEMSGGCILKLRKGANTLLVKSETRGAAWCFYLQPPSLKGAVIDASNPPPSIGLMGFGNVDSKVSELTNWLVVGPFDNEGRDLDSVHGPEREFVVGKMYRGLDGPVTWTIPKIEVLGAIIGKKPWGSHYNWTYYNGGTAWAMQHLAEATGDARYEEYANAFCDYHLEGIPFVEHQVKVLNAQESANHFILDTPLLDFTLAPSIPFINRLRKRGGFHNRDLYERWIQKMIRYAREEQVRLPERSIYTRLTPVKYTTWVDDMFMGIPFLVQAAQYGGDAALRKEFLDDAARQTVEFKEQVWDEEAQLYMHARYSDNPVKLPHWSRCNGWALITMSEVLLHLPEDHTLRPAILEQFQTHARSLTRFQQPDGIWLNVLDHPDAKPEVSGTAIFTFSIARGILNGWLDSSVFLPVALKGWSALESQIEEDGTVHNICEGTMCSEDVNYYLGRGLYDDDTHGLFALIFAGIEIQRLNDKCGAA
jgi:unsaturated rhamnogalacturonyl hydrolase